MKATVIDRKKIEDMLTQLHHTASEANPGTRLDEFFLIGLTADGRLEIKSGVAPRGFGPEMLKKVKKARKAKKKPTAARRPRHSKRR